MTPLRVGEAAPDLALAGSDGKTFHLAALKGAKQVVLAFYPHDFTSG